ncbi:efflux RND transporter periplasmic adaptor subunit [Litoribrevibacter albus]|uniref:RND transporter n=1 Tax=Litoribrevibacter albus TaxID=1473156 RepID=A0AA37SCD9_9GAMM|nr:efflux RND transporter periplasmic adaptor subunit [Litoribrevibacter albus]GLQ32761.1 RND transporter [Litoribrevibacter albus]
MSKLIRLSLPVLVIALTALILYSLVALKPDAKKRPPKAETVIQVETVMAKVSSYQVEMPSRGLVKAQTESTLAAEVSGTVVAISEQLRKGGRFKQGDWLLTIDPRDYEVAVTLAEANLRQAQLALDEEKAKAEQALRDWQRLSKTLNQASEPPDLVLRKPQLAAAEAALVSSRAQLDKAKLDLERTRIQAPFDGFVLSQSVDLGHYVTPGYQLAEISGLRLEITLPVSARWRPLLDWRSIENGTQLSELNNVLLEVGEGHHSQLWQARIVRDGGEVDAQSRQLQLIAEIEPQENSQWPLLPGDYAVARIQGKQLHDVIVLPRTALVDGEYVWKVTDQRLQKQNVEIAWQDKNVVVVELDSALKEQLSENDEVVSSPLSYAISGTKVAVIKRDGELLAKTEKPDTSQDSIRGTGVTP